MRGHLTQDAGCLLQFGRMSSARCFRWLPPGAVRCDSARGSGNNAPTCADIMTDVTVVI